MLDIDEKLLQLSKSVLGELNFDEIDEIALHNQEKVLCAMQRNRLSATHFNYSSGYGYNDSGRDVLEQIYADVFSAEDALVRPQIISGTHALFIALTGNLKSGDELIFVTGTPYDTLQTIIFNSPQSLVSSGIKYTQVELTSSGQFDFENININEQTRMVMVQRSCGYSLRPAISISQIKQLVDYVKTKSQNVIVLVDNCYGEFTEKLEPTDVGADLIAGSLIKNCGGGLASSGGYVIGRTEFVNNAAYKLTGIGKDIGPCNITHELLHGLFIAPQTVNSALRTSVYAAKLFSVLGYEVYPKHNVHRSDIVQSINLQTQDNLIKFCRGVQKAGPIDSYVTPEAFAMPGYDCDIIMAAGTFVQGSSIEFSADAPIKPPYTVFLQGALTWQHGQIALLIAANEVLGQKL